MGTDSEGSFRAHSNYVRSFARLAGFTYDVDPVTALASLRDATVKSSVVTGAQKIANVDLDQVRKSLVNAWGTELLLGLAGEYASEKELVSMANNWGVVQAYYVAYHATQALAVARGAQRPDSHPKTQRMFATHWVNSAFRVPPWCLAG
ncbi:MAG: hypothetical protein LC808_41455, partial [Actinobacteria bacterium]|nr:hypothetical protein [Actinomycetota bacterium]